MPCHKAYNTLCATCVSARQEQLCREHLVVHPNGCDCEPCSGCRKIKDEPRRQQIVTLARSQAIAGEVEFADDAMVSEGDDNGAYVQGWVWVPFARTPLDKDPLGKDDEP